MGVQNMAVTKNASPSAPPACALDILETVCWLFCTMVYFTWYNPIGELAKSIDTGDSILQRIDDSLFWMNDYVPYVPHMIFPYVAVYALPLAYILSLSATRGLDLALIRRYFLTQLALITTAFILYLIFPCKTDLLLNATTNKYEYGEDTWIGRLCFRFVHQGISLYVAFPSMHTAHAFSTAAAFQHDNLKGRTVAWILAVATLFSTVMCKGHTPPHLPAGLLLAYAGQKLLFEPLTQCLQQLQVTATWARFYVIAMAPVLFIVLGQKLHDAAGWKADVPAMFGFESNPIVGLYGF